MKKFLVILLICMISTTAFAVPQRVLVVPKVSSFSNAMLSSTSKGFDFSTFSTNKVIFLSVYNTSANTEVYVNVDGTTAGVTTGMQVPAGSTLNLDYETTGISAICESGETAEIMVYVTFER